VIEDIQTKAQLGRYRMQGFSMHRVVPNLDDLTFVPCTLSRVPLEVYREKCETRTVLGTRFAANPVVLDRPITIAGMSYGALSGRAKTALGTAAKRAGISTTTGDGGMCPEEREAVDTMVYQVLPSRYGFNPDHMKMAQAIEIVVGQGAKPGTGGVLLGSKVSEEIAEQRTLPVGVDQRSQVRHPDSPDQTTSAQDRRDSRGDDWQVPIYVKMGASRVSDDVKLAVKAGADVLVIDGMEGATGASPDALLDHTGVPTLSALCEAVRSLEEMKALGEVQVIISGGIKNGVDAAKALALGADAVSIGTAALIALNCNAPLYLEDYQKLGVEPGFCHHCHTGRCPVASPLRIRSSEETGDRSGAINIQLPSP
jgi:glutamate synthase domain-containing protein 2